MPHAVCRFGREQTPDAWPDAKRSTPPPPHPHLTPTPFPQILDARPDSLRSQCSGTLCGWRRVARRDVWPTGREGHEQCRGDGDARAACQGGCPVVQLATPCRGWYDLRGTQLSQAGHGASRHSQLAIDRSNGRQAPRSSEIKVPGIHVAINEYNRQRVNERVSGAPCRCEVPGQAPSFYVCPSQ